jgi:hypothetical protein
MLVAVVRGGNEPREIATAVFLGVLAGFLTGWNASLAAVLLLVVILHASTRVFCQTWLIASATSWLLTPVTFHAGYFLVARTRIGDGITLARDTLGLVLFDLDRYTLLGGIVVGLAVAVPITWLAIRAAGHLRQTLSIYGPHAEGNDPANLNGMTRAVCCFLYGTPPQAARVIARPRMSRRARWLATGIIVPAAIGGAAAGGPELVEHRLLARMSRANQADVDAGQMRLSLFDGMLYIQDLRFADPDQLDRDRLQVGYVTAVVRPGPLLRGQVQIERLLLEDIRADAPRNLRARPNELLLQEFTPVSAAAQAALSAQAPQVEITAEDAAGGLPLAQYLQDWHLLGRRFDRLRLLIEQIERMAAVESAVAPVAPQAAGYAPLGYAQMRAMRCPFEHPAPQIAVAALRANMLPAEWGLGEAAALEITNLTTNPPLTGQPTKIEIVAPSLGAEVAIEMNLHRNGKKHLTQARTIDRNLSWLLNTSFVGRTLGVHGGRLQATAEGWLSRDRIDLPLEIELTDLSVHVLPGQSVAGVPAETWNAALASVGRMRTPAVLEGSWRSPHLFVDARQFAASYRQQLIAAGHAQLAQDMQQALALAPANEFPQAQASAEEVVEDVAALDPHEPEAVETEAVETEAVEPTESLPPLIESASTQSEVATASNNAAAAVDSEPEQSDDAPPTTAPAPASTPSAEAPAPAAAPLVEAQSAAPASPDVEQPGAPITPSGSPASTAPHITTGTIPVAQQEDCHSPNGLNAGVGQLRYPVTVANQGAVSGQAPARDDRPLIQDLVARRHEARARLQQQQLDTHHPDANPAPIPGGLENEEWGDPSHDDVQAVQPQRRAPPPVSFEVGYDDQPHAADAVEQVETSEQPAAAPTRSRGRNLAGPKAVEPYGSEDGVPSEVESRQGSAIDRLSSGVKQMFSTSGKSRTNGRFSQQGNGTNQPQVEAGDSGDAESSELPGMQDMPSKPKSKLKSKRKDEERQASRPKQTDEDWYKFWK